MPAFVILVNGRQVCSADLGADGSFGVHLNWIGPGSDPLLVFHVGGVTGGERVGWDVPELAVGDEVTVRIVASGGATPPDLREPFEPRSR
jgi:hypothetical protein